MMIGKHIGPNQKTTLTALAFCQLGLCSLILFMPQLASRVAAQQSASADAAAFMKQAAGFEAARQWEQAARAYGSAAKAYEAAGMMQADATASEKSALMYEKYADSLTGGATVTQAASHPATPTAPPVQQTAMPKQTQSAAFPLASSAIVRANKYGGLSVASPSGAPIDGVKISKHDTDIQSPCIVVAPDGVIHVAFREQQARGIECDIYYRSSADGGKSWSEAKNLSEVIPDLNVGGCQIAADGAGRVYVVWRVACVRYAGSDIGPHAAPDNNLVYRVLSGGSWNGKAIPIHQVPTQSNQMIGSASFFVATDPAGAVHVYWNEDPAIVHPEVMFSAWQHSASVGMGLVMESTLDGTTPSAPKQVYLPPVTKNNSVPACDWVDLLKGYVDASGQAHFVCQEAAMGATDGDHFKIIDAGVPKNGLDLPGTDYQYWVSPPVLLVDAQGRQHIITMYPHGEQPNVRDYTVGDDSEPKVIRAVKGNAGKLLGMEAFGGPGGEMATIMHINDTGNDTDEELYVSTSNGGAWSTPVNVTNNSGRIAFHAKNTTLHSYVATESWGYPGASAGTFDRAGHLLLLYVRNTKSIFGLNAFGVETAGGSTAVPKLMFLRF